jgi:hypothetical protein
VDGGACKPGRRPCTVCGDGRLPACWLGLVLAVAFGAGCRHNNCDLVEAELRARECDVRELRDELERCTIYNQALQQEVHALRGIPGGPHPTAAYPVKSLALGRGTGGHSSGSCAGDDGLEVFVEPRDPEGQAIKVPAALLVQAVEINSQGLKRPLSSWEVPPDQLRKSWRSGLMSTGYSVVLPWKVWPTTDKVRVIAQLRLADGRTFEADKDVTVRVPPADRRPALPVETTPTPAPVPAPTPTPTPSPTPQGPMLPSPADDPPPASPPPAAPPRVLPPPRKIDTGNLGGDVSTAQRPAPRSQTLPPSVWHSVEPTAPAAPAAEVLRPVLMQSR